jgi:hypothetical protein
MRTIGKALSLDQIRWGPSDMSLVSRGRDVAEEELHR